MKRSIRYFALMMMGALISGCAEEIEVLQPSASGTVTMKTTVSLSENAFLTGDGFLSVTSGRAERLSGFSMRA